MAALFSFEYDVDHESERKTEKKASSFYKIVQDPATVSGDRC